MNKEYCKQVQGSTFKVNRIFDDVLQITDNMGVSFTLIEGCDRSILFDTGYGMEDVRAFISTLTAKPVTVLLSHGHHDHILGARWFEKTYLCMQDMQEFLARTGKDQREKVLKQAENLGIPVPDDFMYVPINMPEAICFTEMAGPFDRYREDLGSFEVQVIRVPGHTPGSIIVYVPVYDLLLTGDNWNPCTWMWFPSSAAANIWRDRMKELINYIEKESGKEIRSVVSSHQSIRMDGRELKGFLDYMSNERLKNGPGTDIGAPIETHEIRNEGKGWQLIYDYAKIKLS